MKTQNGFLCGTISLILEVEYVKRALPLPHTKNRSQVLERKVLKKKVNEKLLQCFNGCWLLSHEGAVKRRNKSCNFAAVEVN